MGVWIETKKLFTAKVGEIVTPCVGVWIETLKKVVILLKVSHTLRGCVDWNIMGF